MFFFSRGWPFGVKRFDLFIEFSTLILKVIRVEQKMIGRVHQILDGATTPGLFNEIILKISLTALVYFIIFLD